MARRIAPGLPDVFAQPGGAPARGTSIEDLPKTSTDPEPQAAPTGAPTAATAGPPIPRSSGIGGVPIVVWVVLIASLVAPLWEPPLLSGLGFRTPAERAVQRDATALAQADARLAAVDQRLAGTTAQLDALRAGLAVATQRSADAATQARAVALLSLAGALRGSGAFGPELTVLRANSGDFVSLQPVLTKLAPYAATGAPTLDQLARELRTVHDSMAHVSHPAATVSWMDLISWTGLNSAPPAPDADPALRAVRLGLTRLAVGDIQGAIEQAVQVEGPYQTDVADWVAEANARLAADAALRQIEGMIGRPSQTP